MKKFRFLMLFAAVAAATAFVGCKDDSGDPVDPVGPSLSFKGDVGYTFQNSTVDQPGKQLTFGIIISHTADIKKLLIQRFDGTTTNTLKDTSFAKNTKSAIFDFITTGPTAGSTYTYTFTATDENGLTAAKTIVVKTALQLGERTDNEIYNILGTGLGAFDLVGQVGKSVTDPAGVKDLLDASAGQFGNKWVSGNGSKFKIYTGVKPYDGFETIDHLNEAWTQSGTELSEVTDLEDKFDNGKLILCKSAQNGKVYLIRITDYVDDGMTGAGNNEDYVMFDYKGEF